MNLMRLCVPVSPLIVLLVSFCGPGPTDSGKTGLSFALKGQETATAAAGGTAGFTVEITNHGPGATTVVCTKTDGSFPDTTWSSSLCIGDACLPSWVDSAETDPLPANTTISIILDIVAGPGGTGQVAFIAYDAADPSQRYERTFTCTVAP